MLQIPLPHIDISEYKGTYLFHGINYIIRNRFEFNISCSGYLFPIAISNVPVNNNNNYIKTNNNNIIIILGRYLHNNSIGNRRRLYCCPINNYLIFNFFFSDTIQSHRTRNDFHRREGWSLLLAAKRSASWSTTCATIVQFLSD